MIKFYLKLNLQFDETEQQFPPKNTVEINSHLKCGQCVEHKVKTLFNRKRIENHFETTIRLIQLLTINNSFYKSNSIVNVLNL